MHSVTTSLKAFGIYLMLIPGIGLMAVPDFILDLFHLRYGEELWMARLVGLLAFIIGIFDFSIAKHELGRLYSLTVWLRYFAALFMIGLWLSGEVEPMILLFAAIDAAGASWTLLAIKNTVPNPG